MVDRKKKPSRPGSGLRDYVLGLEVDAVGIAGQDRWQGTRLGEQVVNLLPSAHSVVVLAMEVYPEILDLAAPERVMGAAPLNDLLSRHMEYLGGRLNKAAHDIARASHKAGLKALPLPSQGCPMDTRFLEAVLSYKHAAQAAGLGHFGMNGLIVTPQFGPRVRFTVCLTEAELSSTPEAPIACRSCNVCISKCPARALTWPEKDEPYVINKYACLTYRDAAGGCSECMRQCPVQSPLYK